MFYYCLHIQYLSERGEWKVDRRRVNFFEMIGEEEESRKKREKAEARSKVIKILLVVILIAVSAAVKGYGIYLSLENKKIDEKIAEIEESYLGIKGTIDAMNYITQYKTTLSSQIEFLDSHNDFNVEFINKLDSSKIPEVTIKNVSYSKDISSGGSKIVMNCTVGSPEYAPAYIRKLEESGIFKQVQYAGAQAQGDLYSFNVTGIIKEGVQSDSKAK